MQAFPSLATLIDVGPVSGVFCEGVSPKKSLVKIGDPLTRGDLPLTEGSFRQTGRNLDIRLGSCEGITDPWPTPSAAVRRSAQGQARVGSPTDPLRVVYGHPLTLHGSTPV